jgi:hypothetical protein
MLKFQTRGLDEFKGYIGGLERGLRGKVTVWISEWLIGNGQRGLKHYPPYKYVTRKSAYGRAFKTEKQRRYVMAKIRSGEIAPGYPHRTGNLQRGWTMAGEGTKTTIENATPYAGYVMGNDEQTKMHRKIGWRKVADIISTNIAGAIKHAESMIKTLR